MNRVRLLIIALLIISGNAFAKGILVEVKAVYFIPWEQAFRDIYGSGLAFEAEVTVGLWKRIDLWIGGRFYDKKGKLTDTAEETAVKIRTVGWGLKINILKGGFDLYAGAGLNYCLFDEVNSIGTASAGKVGLVGKLGVCFNISKRLTADVFLGVTTCKINPAAYDVNIGGWDTGIGLGYRF